MNAEPIRVGADWLALREPADAAARARELVEELAHHLPAGRLVIHDLGCGTGSMGRWLAPLLPGPQHWVLHDRDSDLLRVAGSDVPGAALGGGPVTVEMRQSDLSRLGFGALAGAGLITASALLDLLTAGELAELADVCVAARCPVLVTLSVAGRVEMTPADPLDRRVAAAFDAHQRRTTGRGPLLGPDAPTQATEEFRRRGAKVIARPSPWRLGAADAGLTAEWFAGWVGAAREQDRDLAADTHAYERRRRAEIAAGELEVTVDHVDLLVLPRGVRSVVLESRRERIAQKHDVADLADL